MSVLVMLFGESGAGKSTSLRNFTNDEVAIINVSGKPMPFKSDLKTASSNDYQIIAENLPKLKQPSIVIDDATYLMVDQFMANAQVKGYDKYTQIAFNFTMLIEQARKLPEDKIVYFIGHSEQMDNGREHFKTIGRMIDNYVTLEGKFTVVLKAVVKDGHYYFQTHNNGSDTVKSPLGMFDEDLIDNDLKAVDDIIRDYWNIPRGE
ncbi:MAG: AAA family ATPase [Clostridiales bacterium]|nr:AAA family ATPase [Clostridiales bacterium]MBQ1571454.1 AAA family ATPase [Clostridiales bacterium]